MTSLLDRTSRGTGPSEEAKASRRLPSAPRTRRPLLVAGSAAVVFVSAAAFASLYSSSNHQIAALVVTRTIPQGQTITGGDLGQASVSVSGGVQPVAVGDAPALAGKRAAVTVPSGSLLVPSDVTSAPVLAPGDAVVGLALKDGQLPSAGVEAGDQVMIVQTGPPGTPVSAASQIETSGSGLGSTTTVEPTGVLVAEARVFDTTLPPANSSGGAAELVSVEVSQSDAAAVSTAATAGQVSLVLLPPPSPAPSKGAG